MHPELCNQMICNSKRVIFFIFVVLIPQRTEYSFILVGILIESHNVPL